VDEKIAIAEPHHSHPSSKGNGSGCGQIFEKTVHNTDVLRHRLVLI
jgi:hypothetical protein